ncbi:MAG: hypothetical protein AAF561_01035 [Planctomycetota bacterium]
MLVQGLPDEPDDLFENEEFEFLPAQVPGAVDMYRYSGLVVRQTWVPNPWNPGTTTFSGMSNCGGSVTVSGTVTAEANGETHAGLVINRVFDAEAPLETHDFSFTSASDFDEQRRVDMYFRHARAIDYHSALLFADEAPAGQLVANFETSGGKEWDHHEYHDHADLLYDGTPFGESDWFYPVIWERACANPDEPKVYIRAVQSGHEGIDRHGGTTPIIFDVSKSGFITDPAENGVRPQDVEPEDFAKTISVDLQITGRTTTASDHSPVPTTVTIPSFQTATRVYLRVNDDSIPEPMETTTVAIVERPDQYQVVTRSATLTVFSNEFVDTNPPPEPTPPPSDPEEDEPTAPEPGDPRRAWVNVALGNYGWGHGWHGPTSGDEQWYGTTDRDGLSTGQFLRLNSDFDEYDEIGDYQADPRYDYDIDGIVPWDGEVQPLWLGMWDDGSVPAEDRGGTWSLTWDDSKLNVWAIRRDADGEPLTDPDGDYVFEKKSSGWSGHTDDLPNGNAAHGHWWWAWGIGAFVEAVSQSASSDDSWFSATFQPDAGTAQVVSDRAELTVIDADLDVDSDNSGQDFAAPDGEMIEDFLEAKPHAVGQAWDEIAGKRIPTNVGDIDEDGVVDFADGYDRIAGQSPNPDGPGGEDYDRQSLGVQFTPLHLRIPQALDPADVRIRLRYDVADPDEVIYDNSRPNLYKLRQPQGQLRIWSRNGDIERGDTDQPSRFIESNQLYSLDGIQTGVGGEFVLYVEAVSPNRTDYWAGSIIKADFFTVGGAAIGSDEVRVIPVHSREGWQRQTDIESDFDRTRFQPDSSFNAVNRAELEKIYNYYGAVYARNPTQFKYIGLAKVAGANVINGLLKMDDSQTFIPTLVDLILDNSFGGLLDLPGDTAAEILQLLVVNQVPLGNAIETELLRMAQEIYDDVTWQHLAYEAGGLREINRLAQAGDIPSGTAGPAFVDVRNAWQQIDSGVPALIDSGNLDLMDQEQNVTLVRGYNVIAGLNVAELRAFPGGAVVVPIPAPISITLMAYRRPFPGGTSFAAWSIPQTPTANNGITPIGLPPRITNHAARWGYIVQIWNEWNTNPAAWQAARVGLALPALYSPVWP